MMLTSSQRPGVPTFVHPLEITAIEPPLPLGISNHLPRGGGGGGYGYFLEPHNVGNWQSLMSLHLKFLDIDHPFTFEESKLRQIEAHALIYLSNQN